MKPLELPGIGAVYYPWRDVSVPIDEQVFDPERIKVFIEGDFYEEWRELLSDAGVWNVKGYGSPLSVELEQVDTPWPIAVLNLKEPIEFDTELEFGPVYLEDGLIAHDVERIVVGGRDRVAQGDGEPCYCSMEIEKVGHHDYIQTEDFAWCLYITVDDPGSCEIPCSDVGSLTKTPTCSLNPKDPDNWGENADTCTFGIPRETEFYMRYLRGNDYNTRSLYDGRFMWQLEVSWVFDYVDEGVLECPESGQRTVTISEDFTAVDTTNPMFLEEPRLVYGPEAADWLEEFWDPDDPNFHEGFHPPPSFFRNDPCGIYLLVHASDTMVGGQGVLGIGDLSVELDIMKTDGTIVFIPYPGVTLGGGIWIDLYPYASGPPPAPPTPGEYDEWPDTDHYPYGFRNDNVRYGEERIVILGMDGLISDEEIAEVKVRVEDAHSNWVRTENLVEDLESLYTVTKVGIIEQNYQGTTVLADFCSVPVCDRPNGLYTLEYAAQVVTSDLVEPPDFIMSDISSPTHEGSSGPEIINVPIYRIDPESVKYLILDAIFPAQPGSCNVHYYARGNDLLYPPNGWAYQVDIRDYLSSQEPEDEDDFSTHPVLYLSDTDYLLAFEGDPSNDQWKDYSIAMSIDSDIRDFYEKALNSMYFGNSERGICYGCNVFLGDKDSYAEDVLDSGVERLLIEVEEENADIGIQSRGDAYFVIGHTYESGSYPGRVEGIWEFIPSANHNCPGDWAKVVSRDDFAFSGDVDREVNWLISQACHLLGPNSYQYWQALIPTKFDSICGFRRDVIRHLLPDMSKHELEGPSAFWGGFSERLTSNEGAHETYWKYDEQIPNDRAIIAWMENACEWARILRAELVNTEHMMENAAAIDEQYLYMIEWTNSPDDWPPFGESYYIIRD